MWYSFLSSRWRIFLGWIPAHCVTYSAVKLEGRWSGATWCWPWPLPWTAWWAAPRAARVLFPWRDSMSGDFFYHSLQRKFHLCIPFLGIARPQSQFPHSWVCEWIIYSQGRSTYFLPQNRQTDPGNIYVNLSLIYECRNWEKEHYNSVFEIAVIILGI